MKFARFFFIMSGLILVLSLLVACSSKTTETPVNQGQQENVQEAAPTEAAVQATEGELQSTKVGPSMPEDVPIMENIRDFQATPDFANISFIVDLDVNEVVAWYQAELPNYGWEMSRAPDGAVGSTANMSRINANKDRLTLTLQHNPIGQFTVVRIVVVRAP